MYNLVACGSSDAVPADVASRGLEVGQPYSRQTPGKVTLLSVRRK